MKHIKKLMKAMVALALVLVSATALATSASAERMYGDCTPSAYINIRSGPSTGYERIGKLLNGEPVVLASSLSNGFYKISSPKSGWVDADYLCSTPSWMSRYGDPDMSNATTQHLKNFQTDLNTIFPTLNLKVDGTWGKATKAAVEKLQQKAGITVDGIAGTYTKIWTYNLSHKY